MIIVKNACELPYGYVFEDVSAKRGGCDSYSIFFVF